MSGVYRCNCDQDFPSHLARAAHAASCLVMERARCVICQSGRISEGDLYGEIEAHRRHVTGGSGADAPSATDQSANSSLRSNAIEHSLDDPT